MVAIIFIITGFAGIAYHASEYIEPASVWHEWIWGFLIRMLAIVCGVLLLRRVNWARWLGIAWLAYHAVLSVFHSTEEAIIHFFFLAIFSFLLFMPKSSAYFSSKENPPKEP